MVLGHYLLGGRLGEGGFGEVFEAWDQKLLRRVAIKRLKNPSGLPQPESLIKEARLAASLQHAAFVKIHALEEDGDSQSIVMELVPGVTLRELIRTGLPDEGRALSIALQVAEAMREAHGSGLIHGDLKPSNLILEPAGKVRILDFGLASKGDPQVTSSLTQTDPQGTIAYMAPERLLGGLPSPRSDIYALGVLLYELAGGARPFATLSGLALAAAHMQSSSAEWPYAETMRPAVVRLIRAMTAREPTQRTGSMQEVCAQISALTEPAGMSGKPPSQWQRQWRSRWNDLTKKKRVALVASTTALLLAVGGWQLTPYWPTLQAAMTPFSISVAMKNGLDALKVFDRPGSLDVAAKNFTAILEREPDSAAAAAGLSIVYYFRYQSDKLDQTWLQKADASAQQALKINDQLALSHAAQGWVLDLKGAHELALAAHDRALNLDPQSFFAWYGKVCALRHLRRYPEAKQNAELGLQHFPQERVFADELGTIYYEQGDYAAAEKSFRNSIVLQPDAVYAYANMAATLLRLGRNDEALQTLQQGLQVRPSAKLYGNLGNVLFVRGDYVGAAAAFENAVSPTKGNPANYLGWANLADTLLWIPGRSEQARQAYEKARALLTPHLERAPNDVTLVSRMALYSARVADKAKAETLLLRALTLAPKSPDVHFRAGLAYELLGNRKVALVEIAEAKSLGYPARLIEAEPALVSLRRDAAYQ